MSPTTTPTRRSTSALDQLQELEAAHQTAAQKANDLAHDHMARISRLHGRPGHDTRGLVDDLRRLYQREPEQFNPDGVPVSPDSDAGQLAAEIHATAAGLDELAQALDHTRRIEARKRQDVEEYIRQNIDALRDAVRPEAEAVALAVNHAASAVAATEVERYLAHVGRIQSWEAIARTDNGIARRVPGAEAAHALRKTLANVDVPTPV
jgi:hypothetical protein